MKKIFVMLLVAVLAMGVSFDAAAKGKAAAKKSAKTSQTMKLIPGHVYLFTEISAGESPWIEFDYHQLFDMDPATYYTPDGEQYYYWVFYNSKTNKLTFSPQGSGETYTGTISGNVFTAKSGNRTTKFKIKKVR